MGLDILALPCTAAEAENLVSVCMREKEREKERERERESTPQDSTPHHTSSVIKD